MSLRSRIIIGTLLTAAIGVSVLNHASGAARIEQQGQRPSLSTKLPPAAREGWWIRVNGFTEASYVPLRNGAAKNERSAPTARARTESDAFDVPVAERSFDAVEIVELAMPPTSKATICVFYKGDGVKLVEFTREANLRVERGERAPECRA